jgi:hypothetical protein
MSEEMLIEESIKESKLIRYVILLVVLVNLIATTAGGYFFIGRYEAKLYQSGAKLAEHQSEFVKLEKDIKSIQKENLDKKENITFSTSTVELLHSLIPLATLDYISEESNSNGKDSHKIVHRMKNNGRFSFRIKEYNIVVNSKLKNTNENIILKEGKDYELKNTTGSLRLVPPSSDVIYDFTIQILPEARKASKEITASLTLKYETNKILIESITDPLKQIIDNQTIENLVSGSYNSPTKLPAPY